MANTMMILSKYLSFLGETILCEGPTNAFLRVCQYLPTLHPPYDVRPHREGSSRDSTLEGLVVFVLLRIIKVLAANRSNQDQSLIDIWVVVVIPR